VQMLDEREVAVDPAEAHRAFNNRPLLQRTAIVIAGPAANFLFAVVAFWVVAVVGVVEVRPLVDAPPDGTPAAQAGIERGEELVAVDGQETPTWQRVAMALMDVGFNREAVPVRLEDAEGGTRTVSLDLRAEPALKETTDVLATVGLVAYTPDLPPTCGRREPGCAGGAGAGGSAPASRWGAGDVLASAD
ncbi:MAG: site-2 protease family protein, partial [Halorhodospira sp.]